METAEVVTQLWACIAARDWDGAGRLVAEDAIIDWPASSERIVGRENFIAVNSTYPEGWSIRVRRVVADGEQAASEVDVPMEGVGVFHAASFWTVQDGQIVHGCEYWTASGADPAPEWRSQLTTRLEA